MIIGEKPVILVSNAPVFIGDSTCKDCNHTHSIECLNLSDPTVCDQCGGEMKTLDINNTEKCVECGSGLFQTKNGTKACQNCGKFS